MLRMQPNGLSFAQSTHSLTVHLGLSDALNRCMPSLYELSHSGAWISVLRIVQRPVTVSWWILSRRLEIMVCDAAPAPTFGTSNQRREFGTNVKFASDSSQAKADGTTMTTKQARALSGRSLLCKLSAKFIQMSALWQSPFGCWPWCG